MKIRVKFEKQGLSRFIGHLDVMRYFQKLNRRACLDVAYSGGFSPHQEMSFATPLGLGVFSRAEYVDIEVNSLPERKELIERMNAVSIPEIRIADIVLLPDDAKNAMSLLYAADYLVSFREGKEPEDTEGFYEALLKFLKRDEIVVLKETKKSSKMTDIRPAILEAGREEKMLFLRLLTGSHENLKPELVLQAFCESTGTSFDPLAFQIERTELYGEENGQIKALSSYGSAWEGRIA